MTIPPQADIDIAGQTIHIGDKVFLPKWRSKEWVINPAIGEVIGFDIGDDGYSCVQVKRDPTTTKHKPTWGEKPDVEKFIVHHDRVMLVGDQTYPPFDVYPKTFSPGREIVIDTPMNVWSAVSKVAKKEKYKKTQALVAKYVGHLVELYKRKGGLPALPENAFENVKTTRIKIVLKHEVAGKLLKTVPFGEVPNLIITAMLVAVKQHTQPPKKS